MAKKLWGGRFGKKTDPLVEEFTKSIHYDCKLAAYDIAGSIAHVAILRKAGYLTAAEASRLTSALKSIERELVKDGSFKPNDSYEDVHTQIQDVVARKVGKLALKLHTARSRNDQVVFAVKMYCKDKIVGLRSDIAAFTKVVSGLMAKNKGMVIPGFTHMQHAQPTYLKDYLGAYIEMLKRDAKRLGNIGAGIKPTLGAGAMAGTPISASKYGAFAVSNSVDTVSDRDFVIEILSALAIVGMHLSRLAEDLIIWSTQELDFIELDEAFCTGSSLMPHKKNPDALELVRGYAGRLYGNLVSVLTTMKGIPLSYNRDMQLDKEPLFSSVEIVSDELKVLAGLLATLKVNKDKIEEALEDESLYATDLVYYLVDKGVAFKDSHDIVGRLVRYALDNGINIKSMTEHELHRFSDKFVGEEIIRLFNPKVSVESKKSIRRTR